MASSVARMPSDDWRHHHPSRIPGATVLGAHAKSLPKVLTRIPTSIDPGIVTATVGEPCSPMTAARRRQSQILDRWAARQARQMITTIDRQAHEAELSALSTITQPVSARAASFSDCSSATSAANAAAPDIPPNVRASSLIQMWRELEAESGLCPTPRATAAPPASSNSTHAISSAEEPSGGSDACDEADSEVFGEWDSAEHPASSSSASSSTAESEISERRKVGEIVRMLSLKMSSSAASSSDEAESAAIASKVPDSSPRHAPPPSPGPTHSTRTAVTSSGKTLPVKESSEMELLDEKLEQERRREVAALAERHPVSRFPFRGRIQSLIRLRSLRREVATIRHQQRSRKLEAERCQTQSNIFSRERSEVGSQLDLDEFQTDENSNSLQVSDGEDNHYQQLITTSHLESSPQSFYSSQAFFTPFSSHEAPSSKESRSPDASWDERTLWGSSFDWSPSLQTFRGKVSTEGTETLGQVQAATPIDCNWLSEQARSRRGWEVTKQTSYHDSLSTTSMDNGEIQELLERQENGFSVSGKRLLDQNEPNDHVIFEQKTAAYRLESLIGMKALRVIHSPKSNSQLSEIRKMIESCLEWQTKLEHLIKKEVSSAPGEENNSTIPSGFLEGKTLVASVVKSKSTHYCTGVATCVLVTSVPKSFIGAVVGARFAAP
ncbi:hypothetical protein HPP92_014195 [Vanilla planifolia]|uniref:Uncharacterized protein n=1 Tax=Vanilla planifolia TaxID=51239 RepID=A0A835UVH0_VANPL|nr:hypothetical protein HPP92_014195 [Vanilla planifolia]